MKTFDSIIGTVASTPIVEMESPFYLTFDINVKGDVVPATFVGNLARALKNSIHLGDKVMPRDGFIDQGKLVFDFMHMEPSTAIGRNADIYA